MKHKAILLKCKPFAHFHFGAYAPDDNTALGYTTSFPHSDTLFSALVINYSRLFGADDTNTIVAHFKAGDVKISSALHCFVVAETPIYFLPKPITFNLAHSENHKRLKKIKFLSLKAWQTIETPNDVFSSPFVVLQNEFVCHSSELPDANGFLPDIYTTHLHTRVQARNPSKKDTLYNIETVELQHYPHQKITSQYYFLLNDEALPQTEKQKLMMAIQYLCESGLGGEKNNMGGFEKIEEKELELQIESPYHTNLSLLCPANENELKAVLYGETQLRGGRRLGNEGNKTYLKTIRLIDEGAILNTSVNGQVVNISPDNWQGIPYLRSGISYTLPINPQWLKNYV